MKKKEKKGDKGQEKIKRGRNKKNKYEGSRWVAVVLLVGTILLSLMFYLRGRIGEGGIRKKTTGESDFLKEVQIDGEPTWIFEAD